MINNFSVVREGQVYRFAQPETADDWFFLANLKLQYIVKLNEVSEGSDAGALCVVRYAPISLVQQLAPMPVNVSATIAFICDKRNWPLGWHCKHGEDRTGLLGAMFRVLMDGWSVDAAEAEMLSYGFHRELLGLWLGWEHFKLEISTSGAACLRRCLENAK